MELEYGSGDDYDVFMRHYHEILNEKQIEDPFIKSSIVELIEAVKHKILSMLQVEILLY